MHMERAVLWAAALGMSAGLSAGLSTAQAMGSAAAASTTPSSLLQPALDTVQHSLSVVKTDKWKRGSVRDEANQDMGSVASDIQVNLPPLLRDADAAPDVVSKQIPVVRNVDALYDVLLRVVDAARIAGPGDQVDSLRQGLSSLNTARLALYDQIQKSAVAQEKQVSDLRMTVQKQAAFKCPAPPPAVPCPTPARKKPSAKPPAGTPLKPATPKSGQ